MPNSNSKGKRTERKAVKLLRSFGYAARRSQQYSGVVTDPDSGDLTESEDDLADGLRPLPARVEVKGGYNDYDIGQKKVQKWIQTIRHETPPGQPWIILWKKDYKPWTAILEISGIRVHTTDVQAALSYLEPITDLNLAV